MGPLSGWWRLCGNDQQGLAAPIWKYRSGFGDHRFAFFIDLLPNYTFYTNLTNIVHWVVVYKDVAHLMTLNLGKVEKRYDKSFDAGLSNHIKFFQTTWLSHLHHHAPTNYRYTHTTHADPPGGWQGDWGNGCLPWEAGEGTQREEGHHFLSRSHSPTRRWWRVGGWRWGLGVSAPRDPPGMGEGGRRGNAGLSRRKISIWDNLRLLVISISPLRFTIVKPLI